MGGACHVTVVDMSSSRLFVVVFVPPERLMTLRFAVIVRWNWFFRYCWAPRPHFVSGTTTPWC